MKESMPLLLVEALDPSDREAAHRHIENCAACAAEWAASQETWKQMGELPVLDVPARVRERFLSQVMPATLAPNVVPFHRRREVRWLAQAAAVAVLVGGSYFAGHRTTQVTIAPTDAKINSIQPVSTNPIYSIAESRTVDAARLSPTIEGRPNIDNVQFLDADPHDGQIGLSFDITSHVTVTGSPREKSMVRLLSYVLESDDQANPSRSRAIEWVRQNYSELNNADPEIANALAKVLRNEQHAGVRIRAMDALNTIPPSGDGTRDALIEALRSDPNPAVRIKAVDALAKLAGSGATLDSAAVDMLRQKASQDDENLYVRVKAAEALSKIRPQ
ncbi:MAG: HEAT repeat domain-containing protein [Thermoanaerobaculia bacterium]